MGRGALPTPQTLPGARPFGAPLWLLRPLASGRQGLQKALILKDNWLLRLALKEPYKSLKGIIRALKGSIKAYFGDDSRAYFGDFKPYFGGLGGAQIALDYKGAPWGSSWSHLGFLP